MTRWRRSTSEREGVEPDPRFTLANERTYLAWVRTAMAFLAAGVAVDALAVGLDDRARRLSAGSLVVIGVLSAIGSHHRWRTAQQALRSEQPLPELRWGLALGYAIAAVGVLLIAWS